MRDLGFGGSDFPPMHYIGSPQDKAIYLLRGYRENLGAGRAGRVGWGSGIP